MLNVPLAVRFEGLFLTLWSMHLFPRQVRIPMGSMVDARIVEKMVAGESVPVLRLSLANGADIDELRSKFRSEPIFGFFESGFDCSLGLSREKGEALADEIRKQIRS